MGYITSGRLEYSRVLSSSVKTVGFPREWLYTNTNRANCNYFRLMLTQKVVLIAFFNTKNKAMH